MDITIRYMLRAVAHCKEGCSRLSWVRRKTAHCFIANRLGD